MKENLFSFFKQRWIALVLGLIILFGAGLRFYHFDQLLRFNNDQARDARVVDQMQLGQWPLFGPKAGGTNFNLGPAFYHLEYLSGSIFGFSPAGIAFFIPLLFVISIYFFHLLFRKIFPPHLALALTFLYTLSFFSIKYSRFAWNPNAIPFFLLAFLLLLNKIYAQIKTDWKSFLALGTVLGIAVQLHTTLFVLMPLTAVLILGWKFYQEKKLPWGKVFSLVGIFLILNFPFIVGNFTDQGENFRAFFSGAHNKTESDSPALAGLAATGIFFIQGNLYQLAGLPPRDNGVTINYLLEEKLVKEIIAVLCSSIFLILGLFLIFKKIPRSKKWFREKENSLAIILGTFSLLATLLFLVIGEELNIRFFIILTYLPFLLLGLIIQFLWQKNASLGKVSLLGSIIILAFTNLSVYARTYDLKNYTLPQSVYGGISQGELNQLCQKIDSVLEERKLQTAPLKKFKFAKSLTYLCQKNHQLEIEILPENEISKQEVFFIISNKDKRSRNIKKYQKSAKLVSQFEINRFSMLVFEK